MCPEIDAFARGVRVYVRGLKEIERGGREWRSDRAIVKVYELRLMDGSMREV